MGMVLIKDAVQKKLIKHKNLLKKKNPELAHSITNNYVIDLALESLEVK